MMMKYSMMLVAVSGAAAVKIAADEATTSNPTKSSGSSSSAKKMLAKTAALIIGSSCVGSASANMCTDVDCVGDCRDVMSSGVGMGGFRNRCFGNSFEPPYTDGTPCQPIFSYDYVPTNFSPLQAAECYHNYDYGGPVRRNDCQRALQNYCPDLFTPWVINCEFPGGCGNKNLKATGVETNATSTDSLEEASTNTTSKDSAGEKLQVANSSCNDYGGRCQAECNNHLNDTSVSLKCCDASSTRCWCSPTGGQSLCRVLPIPK